MSEPLTIHARKPLTPLQRAKLFDEHKGICWTCGLKILASEKWQDEHKRALQLGGTNDWDNRAPVHVLCAKEKDKKDLSRIAKAKRQRAKFVGASQTIGQRKKLKSRGFGWAPSNTVDVRDERT